MMSNLKRLPKNEVEITLEIPWQKIQEQKSLVLDRLARVIEIKGFRKGKAPKKVVAETIGQNKLVEEVLQALIPQIYTEAINKHDLKPVVSPRITPVSLKSDQPWQFKIRTAEPPEISIKGYESIVKKAKQTEPEIWIPGKEKPEEKKPAEGEKLNKIIDSLVKEIPFEISDLLINQEANRLLSQTLEEIKSLGMTLQAYLASIGKTADQIRQEYHHQAERSVRLEFILEAISIEAKIQVTQQDIEKVIESEKDLKIKNQLKADSYALASLLRRQKTLTHLLKI